MSEDTAPGEWRRQRAQDRRKKLLHQGRNRLAYITGKTTELHQDATGKQEEATGPEGIQFEVKTNKPAASGIANESSSQIEQSSDNAHSATGKAWKEQSSVGQGSFSQRTTCHEETVPRPHEKASIFVSRSTSRRTVLSVIAVIYMIIMRYEGLLNTNIFESQASKSAIVWFTTFEILLLTAFGMDQEFASPTLVSLISKRLGLGWIIGILDDFAIFLFTIVVIAQVLA